jgi:hypothetical protein
VIGDGDDLPLMAIDDLLKLLGDVDAGSSDRTFRGER